MSDLHTVATGLHTGATELHFAAVFDSCIVDVLTSIIISLQKRFALWKTIIS